jgi:enoyl-CoA hydratase/carnithine racemase
VLNEGLMAEVIEVMKEIQSNPAITSAVIISGKPGTFIAGADINMIEKYVLFRCSVKKLEFCSNRGWGWNSRE